MYKGKLLTGAVLSVFMAGAYGNASAADGTSDAVYSLNPVVVTATRYEKSDADIPAATQTFTEEQIEQTGADNLQVALQYLDGVIDDGMGPNGTSVSSMTTKNVIRGVSNGTVVMINGTPINWRTNYNLETFRPALSSASKSSAAAELSSMAARRPAASSILSPRRHCRTK